MERAIFEREMKERTRLAEQALMEHLPAEEGPQRRLAEAMNYSLLAGGKRLRPMLMRETYEMCKGQGADETLGAFMAAIEMIHTYSLVHDDLPAMDNDRYRRGKETTWYVYGDAMGILAGDGLLNYAFETAAGALARCCGEKEIPEKERMVRLERISKALCVLSRKAGIYGMIGGQAVDVMDEEGQVSPAEENKDPAEAKGHLLFIHEHKTAALIQAAMMVGAILAGASARQVEQIERCAYNVGIAFQIKDDILDVEGDSQELGKPIGSDAQNNKKTYVTLMGLEQAKADVEALSQEAAEILDGFGEGNEFLKQLILALMHRTQ